MKTKRIKIATLLMSFLLIFCASCAEATGVAEDSDKVYQANEVEIVPKFQGGDGDLMQYMLKTKFPCNSEEEYMGLMVAQFIIEKDGSVSHVELIKGEKCCTTDAFLKHIREMPKWMPGQLHGQNVRVQCRVPMHVRYQ